MPNYAAIWKKQTNFRQIEYNGFISKFGKISDTYFLEKIDDILGVLMLD